MQKIAMVRSKYLPHSETFIYSELVGAMKVKRIMCAKSFQNLEQFPFPYLYRFQSQRELENILRKKKVRLIHARFGTMGVQCISLKRRMGIPLLTSFHGSDLPTNQRRKPSYRKKLKLLYRHGDAFTVPSNDMKRILIKDGCPPHKILIQRSGINIEKFNFIKRKMPKSGNIRIISVGRLVEKKGMEYLVEAMGQVLREYPNVELRIVGDGPLKSRLEELVKSLGLEKNVKLLGRMTHDEVCEEMKKAHIFALASVTGKDGNQEGIPNVLKEAMASGLPVVSTRHAGIPELVKHGKSGYLGKEREPRSLSKLILKLLQKPKQWGDMGKKGRRVIAKEYDAGKQTKNLEKLYKRLLTKA